jgi:superfamily II RNA helicase
VFSILDPRRADWRDVARLQSGASEPVRSRFNLNYASILNLYARVGDRVQDAWKRSFARFHATWGRKRPTREDPASTSQAGRAIQARLEVLREFHYLNEAGLTRKGRLTAGIGGYEIACAEAYEGGFLARCDAVEAAMLYASIVYEARPNDEADPPIKRMKGLLEPFRDRLDRFRAAERRAGIIDPIRGVSPLILGVTEAWAEGEDFAVLESMCTLAAGDLVRIFRMTIQMLRQTFHAVPRGDPVQEILQEAITRIDRDVVDAKRQLELG